MITVNLTEAEAEAVLRVLNPYVARWNDRNADSARSKLDTSLLAHEEARTGRPRPDFDPRVDYPERYTDGPV